jgi:type II secretory pathway pseudopilin PulG
VSVRRSVKTGLLKLVASLAVIMAFSAVAATPAAASTMTARRTSVSVVVRPAIAQAIAQRQVAARRWSSREFRCLVVLWNHESGWDTRAGSLNRSYGIPQALPGRKMASAGSDWRTNPATQIKWGLGYIKGRYNTPCGALSHFQHHHWY